jgi:hypothetical protein
MFAFYNVTLNELIQGANTFTCAEVFVKAEKSKCYNHFLVSNDSEINNPHIKEFNSFWNKLWRDSYYDMNVTFRGLSAKLIIPISDGYPNSILYYYQLGLSNASSPPRIYRNFAVMHLFAVLIRHYMTDTPWTYGFSLEEIPLKTKSPCFYYEAIKPFIVENGVCKICKHPEWCGDYYCSRNLEVNGFESYYSLYKNDKVEFFKYVNKELMTKGKHPE